MTSNNREAVIGDDHSKISYFHQTENVCTELSVEKNGGVEYQNSDDVPYLNFESNNNNGNPNNPPVSLGVSINEMNNNSHGTKRKRKKLKVKNGNKVSPSCKCKKTLCLKLYCECFASGMFCSKDVCGCIDCFNEDLYEDTVEAAKQQILSKNPLAFAQKMVKESETTKTTPSSERRGCNCKQSKCEQRYCECLQAGVPCTETCRCLSCQNPCGIRSVSDNGSIISDEMRDIQELRQVPNNNFSSTSSNNLSTLLNNHGNNNGYFHQLLEGNNGYHDSPENRMLHNNNIHYPVTPENGTLLNNNIHYPIIPFPYTNRMVGDDPSNLTPNFQPFHDNYFPSSFAPISYTNRILEHPCSLAPNSQPFHDNNLLNQPSTPTLSYVQAGSSSNLMLDLRGNPPNQPN